MDPGRDPVIGSLVQGPADCTAVLHYFKGSKTINLASLSFTAGA